MLLDIRGVNIVGGLKDFTIEAEFAARTFNTVRFRCNRFLKSFVEGEDAFTPLLQTLPSEIKLIPMLFNGINKAAGIRRLIELGQLDEWIEYWMNPEFQSRFLFIDLCNEPSNNKWQLDFLRDIFPRVKEWAITPLTIGFHCRQDRRLIEMVESMCEVHSPHFYYPLQSYLREFKSLLDYYWRFNKPIVIGEFNVNLKDEKEQTCWLANVLNEIKNAELQGYCVHCLKEPNPSLNWGIYRNKWTPKKALSVFP